MPIHLLSAIRTAYGSFNDRSESKTLTPDQKTQITPGHSATSSRRSSGVAGAIRQEWAGSMGGSMAAIRKYHYANPLDNRDVMFEVPSDIESQGFENALWEIVRYSDAAQKMTKLHIFGDPFQTRLPGNRLLHGVVVVNEGRATASGTWRHVFGHTYGPMRQGTFEVRIEPERTVRGWYSTDGQPGRNPIIINPDEEKRQGYCAIVANSGRLPAFGLTSAWVFAFLTCLQALATFLGVNYPAFYTQAFALFCNGIYGMVYCSFLAFYSAMTKPPTLSYILGVYLYSQAHIAFATAETFYLISPDVQWPLSHWEFIGTVSLLSGSLFFVYSTFPPSGHPLIGHSASLFWGSLCFFVGSLVFMLTIVYHRLSSWQMDLVGYIIFTLGRVLFIDGSSYGTLDVTKENLLSHEEHTEMGPAAGLQSHFLHLVSG
ncbi:hypothetical protein AAMO2058_000436800 [Amorphochlora amoebiformis]